MKSKANDYSLRVDVYHLRSRYINDIKTITKHHVLDIYCSVIDYNRPYFRDQQIHNQKTCYTFSSREILR